MRARILLGVAACLAASAPSALAADFGGSLRTIVRVQDLVQRNPPAEDVRSWRSVDQHARLTWDDLGERKAWRIDTSLRVRLDWQTSEEKGHVEDRDLDVLLARASWTSRERLLDVQLGRLQSITGLGWKSFDGARLDFGRLERLRVHAFAGIPIELQSGGLHSGGFTWGTGLSGVFPRHGSFGIDYELRRFEERPREPPDPLQDETEGDEGPVEEETLGVDLSLRFKDTQVAANADYSLDYDELAETAIVVGHDVERRHHVEGRFVRVLPLPPEGSIFSVFDINPCDELRLAYEYGGDGGLEIGGYVSREEYDDAAHEEAPGHEHDPPPENEIRRAAITARWTGRWRALHRSEIGWLDGWTGSRLTARHDSDWNVTARLRVGAGASMQDFQNFARLTERDQIWALRTRVRHDQHGRWDLGLEVEAFLGRDRDTVRASLVFGTRFGSARGERPWWGGRVNEGWMPQRAKPREKATVQ